MSTYFAYGSNMDPRLMSRTLPEARVIGPAKVDGFRLEFNVYSDRWEGGAANLEPDPNAYVWGVVWDVEEADLDTLNTFAGHPTFYRREDLDATLFGGEVIHCITYRVAHQQGYVRPTPAYVASLRGAARMQGLPPEALDMIEAAALPPRPHIST